MRAVIVVVLALMGCTSSGSPAGPMVPSDDPFNAPHLIEVTSPSFEQGGRIPTELTCEGANQSPTLRWRGVPDDAKSLVVMVFDPDAPDPAAPQMVWVHWVVYNIPPSVDELPADAGRIGELPEGVLFGRGDSKASGYEGPCPRIGEHRYFFKIYALDRMFPDLGKPTKRDMLQVMRGHVVAQGELLGRYRRRKE